MFLSTGTEIAEHRLHCSQTETLVVPSSPLTDEEYREYCPFSTDSAQRSAEHGWPIACLLSPRRRHRP